MSKQPAAVTVYLDPQLHNDQSSWEGTVWKWRQPFCSLLFSCNSHSRKLCSVETAWSFPAFPKKLKFKVFKVDTNSCIYKFFSLWFIYFFSVQTWVRKQNRLVMRAAMSTLSSFTCKSLASTKPLSNVFKTSCLQNFKGAKKKLIFIHLVLRNGWSCPF